LWLYVHRINSTMKNYELKRFKGASSGQAVIIAVLFFLTGSFLVLTAVATPVLREVGNVTNLSTSKQSYFTAEAAMEDAVYRLMNSLDLSSPEVTILGGSTGTITHVAEFETRTITAVGNELDRIRTIGATLTEDIGVAFFYGVQADVGGIVLDGLSSIEGNVYSNGVVDGGLQNEIDGDVVSAGASGLVDNIDTSGTVYAHSITKSDIDGDAYYQSIDISTTVNGTKYPGSPDQSTSSLPITDEKVADWEAFAEAGGVITSADPRCSSGTYTITNTSITLGPVKIEGNLQIRNSTLTVAGTLWVVGNIIVSGISTVRVSASLDDKSVVLIADNPSNRLSGSIISINAIFSAFKSSGGGYPLFLSMNESAESGGGTRAVTIQGIVTNDDDFLVYAGHGEILLDGILSLKGITGYKISVDGISSVIYETGLANLLFDSGPSGGYTIKSWGEI